jgi:hypothetical protein
MGTRQQITIINSYVSKLLFNIINTILITNISYIKVNKTKIPFLYIFS